MSFPPGPPFIASQVTALTPCERVGDRAQFGENLVTRSHAGLIAFVGLDQFDPDLAKVRLHLAAGRSDVGDREGRPNVHLGRHHFRHRHRRITYHP